MDSKAKKRKEKRKEKKRKEKKEKLFIRYLLSCPHFDLVIMYKIISYNTLPNNYWVVPFYKEDICTSDHNSI